MDLAAKNRTRVRASLSLRPDQLAGAMQIAADDRHGNFSRVFQDLLEAELRSRYGRDWPAVISASQNGHAQEAANSAD